MELLVEQILQSPKLEIYFEQIAAARIREKAERAAFLEKITEDDKAEFINGEAIFHSPVKLSHNLCSSNLFRLLSIHVQVKSLGFVSYEKLMVSLTRNDYEPDIAFWRSETSANFKPAQMRFPAPDFVVEVLSPSTESNDRGVKFEDYSAHGIPEYWIVDPELKSIEQYLLNDAGRYTIRVKSNSGVIRSAAIADFQIPIVAVFDESDNLQALKAFFG